MDPGVTTLMLRPLLLLMLNYPERFGSASGRMIPERILRFRIRFTDLLIMHHVKIFQLKIPILCETKTCQVSCVCVFFNRFFIAAGDILRVREGVFQTLNPRTTILHMGARLGGIANTFSYREYTRR